MNSWWDMAKAYTEYSHSFSQHVLLGAGDSVLALTAFVFSWGRQMITREASIQFQVVQVLWRNMVQNRWVKRVTHKEEGDILERVVRGDPSGLVAGVRKVTPAWTPISRPWVWFWDCSERWAGMAESIRAFVSGVRSKEGLIWWSRNQHEEMWQASGESEKVLIVFFHFEDRFVCQAKKNFISDNFWLICDFEHNLNLFN